MNSKLDTSKGSAPAGDIVKYALALALVAAGVFAFYWFAQWPGAVRGLAVIAGIIAALVVFMLTAKGRQTREFLSESRFELRKVVWPTRQEAGRATLAIIIAVVIISLLLAGLDVLIQGGVKWLLGR